jgi:hypothetical protein
LTIDETEDVGGGLPTGPLARIVITPPRLEMIRLRLEGTTPYMQAKFSKKAQEAMIERMEAGSTAKKGRAREPRDFQSDFEEATHVSEEGWFGIPAAAFRNAAIDACRMTGYQMTRAKMSIFVGSDGLDSIESTPLIRLEGDDPTPSQMPVRNATGVADIRVRPLWREWGCTVRLTYDADQFTASDVVNLFNRAGRQVGIGEGRPYSKKSNGLGFGLFRVVPGALDVPED